ncbi:MAG: hypothetical protein L0220_05560, partial [Acidobacteria bacterium]|nr:hypothetical protein [Acidobacteriota bacterium]
ADGFYGPCDPGHGRPLDGTLPPPELVIQDELHLNSSLRCLCVLCASAVNGLFYIRLPWIESLFVSQPALSWNYKKGDIIKSELIG